MFKRLNHMRWALFLVGVGFAGATLITAILTGPKAPVVTLTLGITATLTELCCLGVNFYMMGLLNQKVFEILSKLKTEIWTLYVLSALSNILFETIPAVGVRYAQEVVISAAKKLGVEYIGWLRSTEGFVEVFTKGITLRIDNKGRLSIIEGKGN